MLPELVPNSHVGGEVAAAMADELRRRYFGGSSVRELAEETGYSIQRVRTLLNKANVRMRPRGRQRIPA